MVDVERAQFPLSAIRPLVVDTQPFPGECLSSVLVRACEANVFTKTSHLLNLIGLHAQASEAVPFTHCGAAPSIAKLIGSTTNEIESRMHSAAEDDLGRSTVRWFGASIERRHIEARVRRFAPLSLEEHAHFPAIWAVRLLDFCPTTMELLRSECPHCSRPLGWRACRSLHKCEKCGASLLGAESHTLPAHLHDAARLGAALVSPVAVDRERALSSLPIPFSNWTPADALVGLLTLGEAKISLESPSASNGTTPAAAKIAAGVEFAKEWPHSFSAYVKVSTARSNTTSIHSGLGPLGKLIESSARQTPIRDLIRSSISMSLGQAVVPAKLFSASIVDRACRDGMLTALEASRQLRIGGKRLRRLEGRSETFLTRHNAKGGVALYDKAAVGRLKDALIHSTKPAAFARQLGIPVFCVEAFVSAGLVKVVPNEDAIIVAGSNLISNASIDSLRERLQSQSKRIEGGVTLRKAMRRNVYPDDWAAVFTNMLSARIRFQIADCGSPSLSDGLIVEPAVISRYVSRRSPGPSISGINVSCQRAAEIIGTTAQFVSAAVKCGFMAGEVGFRNSALPLERVLAFQRQFVLAEELREIVGTHQKSISAQLRKAGLTPVTTINRTTVWMRADIEKHIETQADRYAGPEAR